MTARTQRWSLSVSGTRSLIRMLRTCFFDSSFGDPKLPGEARIGPALGP